MKLKICLWMTALMLVFCVCNVAHAQTMTEDQRQALIIQIKNEIAQLQVQLNNLLAQQQGTDSWCHTFYNNLGTPDSGSSEVFNLHIALQKNGLVYSPDSVNTYSTITTLTYDGFSGIDYVNFNGIYSYVRVFYTPAISPGDSTNDRPAYYGSFDKLLYRS